jgi:hypothetical protein
MSIHNSQVRRQFLSSSLGHGAGFANELADRLSQAYCLPVITDMFSMIEACAT